MNEKKKETNKLKYKDIIQKAYKIWLTAISFYFLANVFNNR